MDEKTGGLELEESLDDFMTMYAAGNATTSTSLLWSIGQLTRNPAVMEKLVEEVFFHFRKALIGLFYLLILMQSCI
jgi:cytochrome P450